MDTPVLNAKGYQSLLSDLEKYEILEQSNFMWLFNCVSHLFSISSIVCKWMSLRTLIGPWSITLVLCYTRATFWQLRINLQKNSVQLCSRGILTSWGVIWWLADQQYINNTNKITPFFFLQCLILVLFGTPLSSQRPTHRLRSEHAVGGCQNVFFLGGGRGRSIILWTWLTFWLFKLVPLSLFGGRKTCSAMIGSPRPVALPRWALPWAIGQEWKASSNQRNSSSSRPWWVLAQ